MYAIKGEGLAWAWVSGFRFLHPTTKSDQGFRSRGGMDLVFSSHHVRDDSDLYLVIYLFKFPRFIVIFPIGQMSSIGASLSLMRCHALSWWISNQDTH